MINLTPHPIHVITEDGNRVTFEPDGDVLRLDQQHRNPHDTVEGIPYVFRGRPRPEAVAELNERLRAHIEMSDDVVLVPIMLLQHVDKDIRDKVYAPDTGPGSVKRNHRGRVMAVRRLVREDI